MKIIQQLEAFALFIMITWVYQLLFPHSWGMYAACFFIPDISFAAYAVSNKWGAYLYNLFHHQGIIAVLIGIGWWLGYPFILKLGFIFLAHSFFDRIFGYGLKYTDSFLHTYLGWIGKAGIPKTID